MKTLKTKEVRWSSGRCKNCALCSIKKRTNSNPKLPKKKPLANTKQIAAMFALFLLLSVFGSVNIYAHDTGTEHIDCQKLYLPAVIGGSTQQAQAAGAAEESTQATLPCGDDAIEDAGRGTRLEPITAPPSVQNLPTEETVTVTTGGLRSEDYGIYRLPLSSDVTNTEPFWIGVPEGCLDPNHELFDADLECDDSDPVPRPFLYYWSPHEVNGQLYEDASKAWIECERVKGNPGDFDCMDYGVRRVLYPVDDDATNTEPFWVGIPFGCRQPGYIGYDPTFRCVTEDDPKFLPNNTRPYFDPVPGPDPILEDFYYWSERLVGDALIVEDHNCAALDTTDDGRLVFETAAHADCYYRAAYAALTVNSKYATELTGEAVELTISKNIASKNMSRTYELRFSGPAESNRSSAILGEDFDLFESVADISNNNPLSSYQVTLAAGELSKTVYFHAYADEIVEVPEIARIQLFRTGPSNGTMLDETTITVRDDEPGFTSSSKLFSANMRLVSGCEVDTNPSGYSVIRLSNDNSRAKLFLSFDNVSGVQVSDDDGGPAHIHFQPEEGDDVTVFNLPAGELPPIEGEAPHELVFQNFEPRGDITEEQHILDALFSGQLYVNIHAGSGICDTEGQISGFYSQLFNASVDFNSADLPEVDIEQLDDAAEIKRDVVRFLTQATFGPTEADVDYLFDQINATGSNRMQVYSAWIDEQIQEEHPSMLELSNAMNFAWHDKVRPEDFGIQRLPMKYGATGHVFPIPHLGEENYGSSNLEKPNTEPYWINTPEICESGSTLTGITRYSGGGSYPGEGFGAQDYPTDELNVDNDQNTQELLRNIADLGSLKDIRDIDGDQDVNERLENVRDALDVDQDGDFDEPFVIAARTPFPNRTVTLSCESVQIAQYGELGYVDDGYFPYQDPSPRPYLYANTPRKVDGVLYSNAEAAWAACANTLNYEPNSSCLNPEEYSIQRLLYPSTADSPASVKVFWIEMPEVCREVHEAKYQSPEPGLYCNTESDPIEQPETASIYYNGAHVVNGTTYQNAGKAWQAYLGASGGGTNPNIMPADYGVQRLIVPGSNPPDTEPYWIETPSVCQNNPDSCGSSDFSLIDFYINSPKKIDDKLAGILSNLEAPKYDYGKKTEECGYLIHVNSGPADVQGKYFSGAGQADCFYRKAIDAAHGGHMNRRVSNDAAWYTSAVYANAQLRERIAFALSEIMVVSSIHAQLQGQETAVAGYYDVLKDGAFGSYEDLLYKVSLNPAMGHYLSMLNNKKEITDDTGNVISFPDENYAREIMQLFSIGLLELHPDGTIALNDADYLPERTYEQDDIFYLAKIFTGWTYSQQPIENLIATSAVGFEDLTYDNSTSWGEPGRFPKTGRHQWPYPLFLTESMRNRNTLHDVTTPKAYFELFDINLEEVTGLDGTEEMERVTKELANHPNVGPFIARRLIQRLVTSNPSRRYIFDVTLAFQGDLDNNGVLDEGKIYGDLKATVKAILLHPEARNLSYTEHDDYGKVKEYIVQYVSLLRLLQPTTQFGLNGKMDANNQKTCDAVGQINGSTVNFDPYIGQATSEDDCYPLSRWWDKYGLPNDLDDSLPNYSEMFNADASIVFAESRSTIADFEQAPLRAPSVFNWFEPDYIPVGDMAEFGLTAPELQHVSESNITGFYNEVDKLLTNGSWGYTPAYYSGYWLNGKNQVYQAKIMVTVPSLLGNLGVSEVLLRELDLYACIGQLYAEELPLIGPVPDPFAGPAYRILEHAISTPLLLGDDSDEQIKTLIYLVSTAPQCRVQR